MNAQDKIKLFDTAVKEYHDAQTKLERELTQTLKAIITDKTIPLEARWKLFIKSKLGARQSYLVHFDSIEGGKFKNWCRAPVEDYIYDGFNRGHEFTMVDMEEQIRAMEGTVFEVEPTYEDHVANKVTKVTWTKEDTEAWQEEVLAKTIRSFRFDW